MEGRNGEDQEGWGDWAKGGYEVPSDVPDYCHGTGTVTSSLRRGYSLIYPPQDPSLCSLYTHILQVGGAAAGGGTQTGLIDRGALRRAQTLQAHLEY